MLSILVPIYNDWSSFSILLRRLDDAFELAPKSDGPVRIVAVNDGSSDQPEIGVLCEKRRHISAVHILNLVRNVGHQKAIAIGLSYLAHEFPDDAVVVMDSDGEDKPEDVSRLLHAHEQNPDAIIFARRLRRSEGIGFRMFYWLYKIVFRILTGQSISFGNFSLIPPTMLRRVTMTSETWNHFSSGILKSKIPFLSIETDRGKRIGGRSKMNFSALVLHGLSALSVHIDVVSVRFLVLSLCLMVLSALIVMAVVYVKFFTPFATPGWSTTIVVGFSIMVVQSFFISIFLVFVTLINRTHRLFLPFVDWPPFVDSTDNHSS